MIGNRKRGLAATCSQTRVLEVACPEEPPRPGHVAVAGLLLELQPFLPTKRPVVVPMPCPAVSGPEPDDCGADPAGRQDTLEGQP